MKKLFLLYLIMVSLSSYSQITLSSQFDNVKFSSYQYLDQSGEKIFCIDTAGTNWKLLNTNGSNFASGTLPNTYGTEFPDGPSRVIVSEKLFDADSQIEILFYSTGKCTTSGNYTSCDTYNRILIVDDNSNILLYKKGYALVNVFNTSGNSIMLLKGQLKITSTFTIISGGSTSSTTSNTFPPYSDSVLVYSLPGQLNCSSCSINTSISNLNSNTNELSSLKVFPNPQNEISNIEYKISPNIKNKTIEIYSVQGTLVKQIVLTDNEGKVQINTMNLSSGLYLYSIIGDGKTLINQKIIKVD